MVGTHYMYLIHPLYLASVLKNTSIHSWLNVPNSICFFPVKVGLCTSGKEAQSFLAAVFLKAAQLLPLPLGTDVYPHPFPHELEGPLVLGNLDSPMCTLLTQSETIYLWD